MATAQQLFTSLALTTPARRFAAGTLATGALLITMQPDAMFQDGHPKEWSLIIGEEDSDVGSTILPWWLAAGAVGSTMALFF